MNVGCENWSQAVSWVLMTGMHYVHDKLTIRRCDGSRNIAIDTVGKSQRMSATEAVTYLEANFEF